MASALSPVTLQAVPKLSCKAKMASRPRPPDRNGARIVEAERGYDRPCRARRGAPTAKMPNSTMKKAIVPHGRQRAVQHQADGHDEKVSVSTEPHRCTVAPKGIA